MIVPLGKWVEVAAELKKGHMISTADGIREEYKRSDIQMKTAKGCKSLQIDFKGLDHGQIKIDYVKL